MSSIISDLFYGSKQNILDNYLINRHEPKSSSLQHKQETVLYASFIQFVITIPSLLRNNKPALLKIQVEMGNRSDQGFVEIKFGQKQTSSIILTLNQLGKQDLNKYTNIRITISEGKYDKIHGFIPIESIKNIANSFSNEKTITVHMKGKKAFPFSSVQCTIRTEFPNNNILNSEIMKSIQKDQTQFKSKQQFSEEVNQTYSPKHIKALAIKKGINYRNQSHSNQYINMRKRSSNIVIQDQKPPVKANTRKESNHQKITEFVKEVMAVPIRFTKLDLGKNLKVQNDKISLRLDQQLYRLMQIVQIKHLKREGINFQIIFAQKQIGFIHLSPLLLTLDRIYGQIPIYSQSQQCLGTIVVQSADNRTLIEQRKMKEKPINVLPSPKHEENTFKELILLSLEKIIMVSLNNLNSSEIMDQPTNIYDFTKMELNRNQVIIRLNGTVSKFTDVVLNYTWDGEQMKVVELKRKQGFIVQYFEGNKQQILNIEIQLFSAYRLVSYSKMVLKAKENFSHKFMAGDTSSNTFYCGLYLKISRLEVQSQYFQQHKINTIFRILGDILQNKVMIEKLDDSQIKMIISLHKKITYVEVKKLFVLLQKYLPQIINLQNSFLLSIYSKQRPEVRQDMMKIGGKLLQQFSYLDYKNQKMVSREEFSNVIQFYKEQLKMALGDHYQQFVKNPISTDTNILYIFFVCGIYSQSYRSINVCQTQLDQSHKQQERRQIKQQPDTEANIEKVVQVMKDFTANIAPTYSLSKISIHNAHILNLGKAPNITLNLTKKVFYSNSNPEFLIEKQVSLLQNILVYHKSIAQDRLIQIAQFKPNRRQTHYELQASGKCFAKINWSI